MTDPFRTAKLARKNRTKWWRQHIALAYIILTSAFALVFLTVRLIDRKLPEWLTALGVSPSGVNLIIGTAWCGLGLWGIRTKGNGGRSDHRVCPLHGGRSSYAGQISPAFLKPFHSRWLWQSCG
jgi:hypothetical protein